MAKSFDIKKQPVYSVIEEATAEEPAEQEQETKKYKDRKADYTAEEIEEAQRTGNTAGKKGIKAKRINMAFTLDNYDYIKTMAKVTGENLTDFVNHIVEQSMADNMELYNKAKEFKNSLK